MSGISFRYIKTKRTVDSSYCLYDGGKLSNATKHWFVGDKVSICFDGQGELCQYLADNAPSELRFHYSQSFIQIPCVVVQRTHSAVWKDVGAFQHLIDSSICLEAISGDWEDILLWIIIKQVPEWAKDTTSNERPQ